MTRAILLLATFGLAVSGCGRHCNDGTLTLFWQKPQGGFTTATGQLLSCDEAGVSTVDVSVNGVLAGTFPCHGPSSDGITLTGFFNETVSVQVDAFDASNNLLYQDVRTTSTAACGNIALDVTLAAVQAPFQISYALPGGIACPPSSFIWLSLVDVTGNVQFDLVDANNTPTAIPCDNTDLIYDKALFGQYRLDFIQVVQPTGNPLTPFVARYEFCSPLNFNHQASGDVFIVPTLFSASGFCG